MNQPEPRGPTWLWSRTGLVLIGFRAIAAFLLIWEHTAHGGHGRHDGDGAGGDR